ncbi:hypothetical protein BV25DRAFT_1868127 [Artomyces pyxidatus]|uniref:Uncharacterized protein n=1 Tax=Artomyces pyxidatus TaxID=48021 RepID=A0ACB8TFE9_9AGAM|nr:hypothetical protein BV25DRAFT_1868127 [Artomyces pyxidatus]
MRQKTQTKQDAMFRTALENMRYNACTTEDIKLLMSRVAGPENPSIDLSHPNFRYVSVITALNAQRDQINTMGCRKFAADSKQQLVNFYAVDKWKTRETMEKTKDFVPMSLQKKLQDLEHGATMHVPGTLRLCQGLPVMIKRNEATEVCVTNGAEGTVVENGQETLDVVFVKLKNPPTPVQLEGLPQNSNSINKLYVTRAQVPLIPNFAMTDYASQGRTRPYNVVDLKKCRSHQSVYTCLSRSSSLDGTVLVQSFDPSIICKGLSGYLRQEFRELELLDEITRLRYLDDLPKNITAETRQWAGQNHVPEKVHPSIRWSKESPLVIGDEGKDSPWQLISTKGKSQLDKTSKAETSKGQKRKRDDADAPGPKRLTKRRKIGPNQFIAQSLLGAERKGILWNGDTLTCAYDSILTILLQVYLAHGDQWTDKVTNMNGLLTSLSGDWSQLLNGAALTCLESARDKVQTQLNTQDPDSFPLNNSQGTDIYMLSRIIGDKGNTWYHDGIATGRLCTPEDKFSNIADIYKVANRQATVLIYSALF